MLCSGNRTWSDVKRAFRGVNRLSRRGKRSFRWAKRLWRGRLVSGLRPPSTRTSRVLIGIGCFGNHAWEGAITALSLGMEIAGIEWIYIYIYFRKDGTMVHPAVFEGKEEEHLVVDVIIRLESHLYGTYYCVHLPEKRGNTDIFVYVSQ